MKLIKILFFLLLPIYGFSQVKEDEKKPLNVLSKEYGPGNEDNIYNTAAVQVAPDFPGGLNEFYTYIGKNFKVPDVKGLTGKIFVTFVVEKDGSLNDIKVIRDIGYGSGEEAVRVLKNSPNWIPAEQNGQKVRVLFTLPISIRLP